MLKSFKLLLFSLLLHIYGKCLATNFSSINSRIKGGTDAKKEDIYFLVSVCDTSAKPCKHLFGGSLVTQRAVVSAANLLTPRLPLEKYGLNMGSLKWRETTSDTLLFNVAKIIVHEKFNDDTGEYNVAILLAKGSVPDKHFVHPIKLPEYETKPNSICQVLGWGETVFGGKASDIAKTIPVMVAEKSLCNEVYGITNVTFPDEMICTAILHEVAGPCSFDKGGPLKLNDELVGIVILAMGCGNQPTPLPEPMLNVFYYKEWILKNSSKRNTLSILYIILITVILKFTM